MSTMPHLGHPVPPYPYSGLSFEELPLEAQNMLNCYVLSADSYDPAAVEEVRHQRAGRLYRNLTGVFDALVTKRREVVGINAALQTMQPGRPEYTAAEDTYVRIARHVYHELLPELHGHLDRFIRETDALVWFEQHVRDGTPDAVSEEERERYRGNKMAPVIEGAFDLLFRLDAAVVMRDLENLEREVRAPPPSPTSPTTRKKAVRLTKSFELLSSRYNRNW
ncbi:hypothetical protein LshimejAT787_1900570 [Lyophyllum shimeji]|uniref:Uncharacterized protein n=1 Tax=Lyophyllum shimeji TaxID=47721 RepID=A0A9P3URE0_LYOSH|nr:hypothetical protein LshimejAT787_1900570 [Lyophyllum shimeji]